MCTVATTVKAICMKCGRNFGCDQNHHLLSYQVREETLISESQFCAFLKVSVAVYCDSVKEATTCPVRMGIFASACCYCCFLLRFGDGGGSGAAASVVVVQNEDEDDVTTPAAIAVNIIL